MKRKSADKAEGEEPKVVKKLICSWCRTRASSSTPWACYVMKGKAEIPDGDACKACHLLWATAFPYVCWGDFVAMKEKEELSLG